MKLRSTCAVSNHAPHSTYIPLSDRHRNYVCTRTYSENVIVEQISVRCRGKCFARMFALFGVRINQCVDIYDFDQVDCFVE